MAVSKYIDFVDLVDGWSEQSGELPLLTLRRICDWAISGHFPEGTFLLPNGEPIDLLELYWAMKREIGAHAPIDRDYAAKLLNRIIVSKSGIRKFCEHHGIELPPGVGSLTSSLRRLVAKPRHLGPPDCPGGPAAAVRREAIDLATAGLDASEDLIAATQHSIQGAPERELDPWCDDGPKFEARDEPDLPAKPGELGSEWKGVDTAARPACEVISEPTQVFDSQTRRSAGRPPGSGSYQAGDLELVEEMRADILAGKHTSIAAAARARVSRAAGFGSEASKEKRLTTRYSERYPA
ncbi:hypothetical protein CVM73_33715 [Bradyrhizobium forestalis]|uniref:Uncharacterized protein n=1 Tax=Bradyrhizobium forestalis TaxID=1419263 RepID=A0A2M8QZE8_9BRAD|nr:hypothetical protein [Bradyrhizobium forestalis]PJG50932.1 hypothetical protein CVM73_33715 [Bradyrhizobium forestalis]